MKISELIEALEEKKEKEGDLNVCLSEYHEYWGSIRNYLKEGDVFVSEFVQPENPKSSYFEKALVFENF